MVRMMRTATLAMVAVAILSLGILTMGGCSSEDKDTIVVGSHVFSEAWILGEIAKLLIEENVDGVEVDHISGLQGSQVLHGAITSGEIDLYLSWTGTDFTGRLDMDVTDEWRDPQKVYDFVKEQFEERYQLTLMPPLGFENTYAISVTSEFANKHGLERVSQLKEYAPDLTIGVDQWFMEMDGDGYDDFVEHYGLDFGNAVEMDYGILYRAVDTGDVDVVTAYSTDGRIVALNLVILEDDLNFFPPYDGVYVISQDLLDRYPEVWEALSPLFGTIDERTMAELNAEVDVHEKEFEDVAREFLVELGLID